MSPARSIPGDNKVERVVEGLLIQDINESRDDDSTMYHVASKSYN